MVLLLEDESQLVLTMQMNLQAEFEIESASTVEEALLLLGTRRFDVLLCDHGLPGRMQGLDFLVEAMRLQPSARRILITGYMNPDFLARSVTLAKLSAMLLKPATTPQIRKALHDAIGFGV